jgi:hypothetical protein
MRHEFPRALSARAPTDQEATKTSAAPDTGFDQVFCYGHASFEARERCMVSLIEDAQAGADWVAAALTASGYRADFSAASLGEVDRFFDKHARAGKPVPGGLLSDQTGYRIFALGGYVGEVLRRGVGGEWQANDLDPRGEVNVTLRLSDGSVIAPMQRVFKRLTNGAQDGIAFYGASLGLTGGMRMTRLRAAGSTESRASRSATPGRLRSPVPPA